MNPLATKLIDLEKAKGPEVFCDDNVLKDNFETFFKIENTLKYPFEKCRSTRFFYHAFYKTNVDEILFMRHKTISDLLDERIQLKDATAAVDAFVQTAEYLRKIDIMGQIDEAKNNPYELLSGAIRKYNAGEYRSALTSMTMLSSSDMAEAHYYLGRCFYEGKATKQDAARAVQCFTQGAAVNCSGSIYMLGMCFLNGFGAPKNPAKGLELILKAADLGQQDAVYMAGYMYKEGTSGVSADIKKAIAYLQKSANYGNWSAAIAICDLYYEDAKTTGNFNKTSMARKVISDVSDPNTLYHIAKIYAQGIGVQKDLQKALNFSTKAASKGNADAKQLMTAIGLELTKK